MNKQLISQSKFLSLVLRHDPAAAGVTLDGEGWTSVDALVAALHKKFPDFSRAALDEIVSTNPKKRFAFSEDGNLIRASQGHSVDVDLGFVAQPPPSWLYHGTAVRFLDSIRRDGLIRGKRTHVHLSVDVDTAQQVGMRHGKPHIFRVEADAMVRDGFLFYLSENGVWLTEAVPVKYLSDAAGNG